MRIIKATRKHAKEISELMLNDLENPNALFPEDIISKFREHAKEKSILKEFENPNLISFVALNGHLSGFIVGYKQDSETVMIHYVTGGGKKQLLDKFIEECRTKGVTRIITDTFEFMDNNEFFKANGFLLFKKKSLTKKLEML